MKSRFLYLLLVVCMVMATACEEEEPFAVLTSDNSILINNDIDNRIVFGGIAGGAGIIPTFKVNVGSGIADVTVTNRYRIPGQAAADPDKLKVLGTFPVTNGEATVPDILISDLRDAADPAITATTNVGVNSILLDAGGERRICTLSLANTFILVDGDIYTPYITASTSSGIAAFNIRVTSNNATVTVVHRYTLPGTTALKDQTIGGSPFTVDAGTGIAAVPAISIANLRQDTDPDITGLDDAGQNYIRITAGGVTKQYTVVWTN